MIDPRQPLETSTMAPPGPSGVASRGLLSSELVASYWALAGDRVPGSPDEVSPFPIEERGAAAAQAGFSALGLLHVDLVATDARLGLGRLAEVMADLGLDRPELEMLLGWYSDGEERRRSDEVRDQLLRAADLLGARHIKIGGDFVSPPGPFERMTEEFARLCREAQRSGTLVTLEPIPGSGVPDVRTARRIVEQAGEPNGKLCLDVWHVFHGAATYAELAALPGDLIGHVELCDGSSRFVSDFWSDVIHERLLPGEGEFDVVAFLRAIRETGYRGTVGVEIQSARLRAVPLHDAVALVYDSAMAALEQESTLSAREPARTA